MKKPPLNLKKASYISFSTFRKNGDSVETPVWFAPHGDHYYVFSAASAGKVKRLRNSTRSRIAPCSVTGALHGDWRDSRALILQQAEEIQCAKQALLKKYGWQMCLLNISSWIGGKINQRAYIKITLDEDAT